MPELQRLGAEHESAVLVFELVNRSYFAASISDRGEEYFASFSARHAESLAEQGSGRSAYYVLGADDGSIVGRFNLRDMDNGVAMLGYRVAQSVAGHGLATATVVQLCREAASMLGLSRIRAATSDANIASRRVLLKAGFVLISPADPADLGGRPGGWYERHIALPRSK